MWVLEKEQMQDASSENCFKNDHSKTKWSPVSTGFEYTLVIPIHLSCNHIYCLVFVIVPGVCACVCNFHNAL